MMTIDPLQSEDGLLRCKVQSLQLPEELGTINHIFSDKTGTLTKNELILRSMSMRGVLMSGEKTDKILQAVYAANCETTDMLFKCFTICTDVTPMLIDGKKVMSGTS
jgi:P-type E1-E2 ATPase